MERSGGSVSYIDIILLGITISLFIIKIANDTQVYFYSNYILFSIIFLFVFYIISGYVIPKIFGSIAFSQWYYLSIVLLGITLSFWNIPKVLHYYFLDKKEKCITSKLTYKYFSYTSGNVGRISFNTEYQTDIPNTLLKLNSLSAVSKETFDALPNEGLNIQICGDVSQVGFVYSYIEK
ncbi:MAG TPA: hypothetical protein VIM88_04915 [Sulfurovum sp.]|uniref:hypothetical protein n=1 Tax=Sulfurovum sp. TaxID=1969726 RepID=UPI002F9213A7